MAKKSRQELVYIYVHASDEQLWDIGVKLGLQGEVLQLFSHAGDEFKLGLEVDLSTGLARAVTLDDRVIS